MLCLGCGTEIPSSLNQCPHCGLARAQAPEAGRETLLLTSRRGHAAPFGGLDAPTLMPPASARVPPKPGEGPQTLPPPVSRTADTAAFDALDAPTLIPQSRARASAEDAQTLLSRSGSLDGPFDGDATLQPGIRPAPSLDGGPLAIGSAFGSRYHIIRLLGIGGMGAVYQAWDAELSVAVAIKVIRPEVMEDPGAAAEIERRFKRELLLARQVTHKNVVRIHDLGEIHGIKYITMPYIDGFDLATVLKINAGRLPIPRILHIARAAVAGLVEAHKAGVVHRDLKPANIMIASNDEAMLMDFGIALSAGAPPGSTEAAVEGLPIRFRRAAAALSTTMQGVVVGTIEYMAPEQARGQEVDQRADIYSFGLILYDMLVGHRRAERATSAIAELQERMAQSPPPPRSIAPDIPEALDQMVSRCLEPDPAKRYQTTADLASELARLDENGVPIPVRRVLGLPQVAAIATALLTLGGGGAWWYAQTLVPEAPHPAVSVVIADFQNTTNDSTFDRTLEPVLKRGLEGAGFITAYDRTGISRTLGVKPPEKLDETAARELAVKQGLGVVVSGAIAPQGNGYEVSIKASQTVSGDVITTARGRAPSKDKVLETATKLVASVRKSLGDKTSESEQMFTMASLSATSLDVVHHYGAAMEAQSRNNFEEARASFLKTVELDPTFGIGYQGLSVISRNLGKLDDADTYIKQALQYLDGMTERERFVTRGMYYRVSGDYQQCVKEYGELVSRYAGDAVGHNQRALCLSKLRDLKGAVEDMRQVVQLLPKRVVFRDNLALYANYASDFQTAEQEALAVEEPDVYAVLALAFSQLGQGRLPDAVATYTKLATMGALGASFSAFGLADVALYEGRFSDAVRGFETGAAADLAAKNPDKAAAKLGSLAYAHLMLGHKAPALAAADRALTHSKAVPIRLLASRIFVETGAISRAEDLSKGLSKELQSEPQAYGKIIEGELALKGGNAREAVKLFAEANGLLDTWLGHFDLGRAYLALEAFPQADSEFDRCVKRKGEALSLFVDEEPTLGYFPMVYYYQGRVREGLHSAGYGDLYREYLNIRGKSKDDPLLPEVRRRAGI